MTTTDTEKVDMNTAVTTNRRLVGILLVLLIVFVILLIIGIVAGWLMMGGMMGWGGMMGINGQTTNNMVSACTNMMRTFQTP